MSTQNFIQYLNLFTTNQQEKMDLIHLEIADEKHQEERNCQPAEDLSTIGKRVARRNDRKRQLDIIREADRDRGYFYPQNLNMSKRRRFNINYKI